MANFQNLEKDGGKLALGGTDSFEFAVFPCLKTKIAATLR